MAAYMLMHADIGDEERYATYRQAAMPLIEAFGGKIIAGGKGERLEGLPDERQTVLFEFPSMEAIHAFWDSPEYAPVKELRRGVATVEGWALPGH